MPGSHLNETEKKLQGKWNANAFGSFPTLRSIEIKSHGDFGLRGIKKLRVEFAYPVTFFSGQNGSGKSTLLALAALAYHGAPGHEAVYAKNWSKTDKGDFTYYTYKDFFHRGPGDRAVKDVEVFWNYDGRTKDISFKKVSDKWMRNERRPSRPVEYFGISRAMPSFELSALKNQFGSDIAGIRPAPLDSTTRATVEKVLGRQYPHVEKLLGKKFSIRRTGVDGYTSFNMGAGEDSLMSLLARLSEVPKGTLVVIDEVETALHPAAQRKLAAALLEIALERDIQIIGSTHSHHFLDCLPRVARALLVKEGESHRVVPSPTTMLAMSELSGLPEKELLVICEDQFAATLISNALTANARKRVDIHACGSNTELAIYARGYLKFNSLAKCLIVWDGDVSDQDATGYLSKAKLRIAPDDQTMDARLKWTRLPGAICPEMWALQTVRDGDLSVAMSLFGCDSADQAGEMLNSCGMQDVHSIPFEISQRTGFEKDDAANKLICCAVRNGHESLVELRSKVDMQLG
jgi:predicted ATPase